VPRVKDHFGEPDAGFDVHKEDDVVEEDDVSASEVPCRDWWVWRVRNWVNTVTSRARYVIDGFAVRERRHHGNE
jgi:hypothetical protein